MQRHMDQPRDGSDWSDISQNFRIDLEINWKYWNFFVGNKKSITRLIQYLKPNAQLKFTPHAVNRETIVLGTAACYAGREKKVSD